MSEATCEFAHISSSVPGGQLIAMTLERLRSERGELEDFLESMFTSLDDLGARLTQRQSHLAEHEAQLREREAQLTARQQENEQLQQLIQSQATRLESMADELQTVREELGKKVAGEGAADDSHLQGIVQRLEEQRDDLKQRLDVCREELARRNDATEQLAKSQLQLASAREEILQLREQFELHRSTRPDPTAFAHASSTFRGNRAQGSSCRLPDHRSSLGSSPAPSVRPFCATSSGVSRIRCEGNRHAYLRTRTVRGQRRRRWTPW